MRTVAELEKLAATAAPPAISSGVVRYLGAIETLLRKGYTSTGAYLFLKNNGAILPDRLQTFRSAVSRAKRQGRITL